MTLPMAWSFLFLIPLAILPLITADLYSDCGWSPCAKNFIFAQKACGNKVSISAGYTHYEELYCNKKPLKMVRCCTARKMDKSKCKKGACRLTHDDESDRLHKVLCTSFPGYGKAYMDVKAPECGDAAMAYCCP